MRVRFLEGTDVVEDLVLVYGGMAATTVLTSNTRAGLRQQLVNILIINTVAMTGQACFCYIHKKRCEC